MIDGVKRPSARVKRLLCIPSAPALALCLASTAAAAVTPGVVYGTGSEVAGSAPGEVRSPEGIGVDPVRGRIVLADYQSSRVSIFKPDGSFVLAFGKDVDPGGGTGPEVCTTSCKAGASGSEAGELSSPYEAEFSPSGREIFVGDSGNNRISVFSDKGVFLRAFGADVVPGGDTGPEVCTTSCKEGLANGLGGSFTDLWPMTFGPDGLLYVDDTSAQWISVFRPDGTWLRQFGKDVVDGGGTGFEVCTEAADCKVGVSDGSLGSFDFPEGLDFDPTGRLWVGSASGNQVTLIALKPLRPVAAFGKDAVPGGVGGLEVCTVTCQLSPIGTGPGEFDSPNGIGIGADGTAYVADPGNNRVNAYRKNLRFAFGLGADVVPGGGTGFETCTTSCQAGSGNEVTGFDFPYGVAVDCRGVVYVTSDVGRFVPARSYADHGLQPGPCTLSAELLRRNKRNGTAKLAATVPYASKLSLAGKNVRTSHGNHSGLEGPETLRIKPKGKLVRRLHRTGRAKVTVTIKMEPSDGNVGQKTKLQTKLAIKRKR